ncbi:Cyanovirin-N [Ceratobasidium sp. AG-I]|nr:Cyanovirin-N [Ceratobasidium sp. AG-I]
MYFSNILAAIGFSLFAAMSVSAGGGFSASCSNFYMQGNNVLTATCGNGSGGSKTTSIDLNRCIANYGGNLACAANGGYGGSCSGCLIRTGTYMICHCGPNNGTPIIDLNSCVANYSGNLSCAT